MPRERSLISAMMRRLHAPIYACRLRELVRQIAPHLEVGDRVLDVGCGFGALGRAIMDSDACPRDCKVVGLEPVKREGSLIQVDTYNGRTMPYDDRTFDVIILADVLHHEEDPHRLLAEATRVTNRLLIIKDHKLQGPLAQQRIALIDWAANAPYDVPCLYRYNTLQQWGEWHQRHHLSIERELPTMKLYPPIVNLLFGGRLQYMAVLRVDCC